MTASEQIIQVLDEICKKFGLAIDWSKDNILPYVQELGQKIVRYDLWNHTLWLVIGILFSISGFGLIHLLKTQKKKAIAEKVGNLFFYSDGDFDECGFWTLFLIGILFLISALIIIFNIQHIIRDLTFPELTILNFIKPYLQ